MQHATCGCRKGERERRWEGKKGEGKYGNVKRKEAVSGEGCRAISGEGWGSRTGRKVAGSGVGTERHESHDAVSC